RIVYPQELLIGRHPRLDHPQRRSVQQAQLLDERYRQLQPLRVEGVVWTKAVLDVSRVPHQRGLDAHPGEGAWRSFPSAGQPTRKPASERAFSASRGSIVARLMTAVRSCPGGAAGINRLTMFSSSCSLTMR